MNDRQIDTAISSLGRRELEQTVFALAAALYKVDGEWDIDTEWEAETVEHAAEALPQRVVDAIKVAAILAKKIVPE